MPAAFDPFSCAILAHIVEISTVTCLCPIRRPRAIPRARQWLHRNSERAFELTMEDTSESVLDVVNNIEPRLAIFIIIAIWLRITLVAHERTAGNEPL
jgi:hypothetical protein